MSASVVAIPTALNAETAWAEYAALMRQYNAQPELRLCPEHCANLARAWQRWQFLFLALEGL